MNLTKNILIQTSIILFFSSCQNQLSKNLKNEKQSKFPIITDTIGALNYIHYYDGKNPTWLSTSSFSIFYIGEFNDTIYVDPFMNFSGWPVSIDSLNNKQRSFFERKYEIYDKFYVAWPLKRKHKYYDKSKIQILVDTINLIDSLIPVLVSNKEIDTIVICYGDYLPMIIEAMDSTGKWRPIQEEFEYMCGNGVGTYILPPNNTLLTFAPQFKGEFKTKLRFKIGNNHSESFNGSIHYRQFKNMFTENGDYCDEYKLEHNM